MISRRSARFKAPPPPSGGAPVPSHWWRFDQADGQVVADTGDTGGISGNLTGSQSPSSFHAWRPTEDMGGVWTGALEQTIASYSGSRGNYYRVDLSSIPAVGGLSKISFSVRFNAHTSGASISDMRLFSISNDNGEQNHVYMLGFTSNTTVRMRLRRGGNTTTYVLNTNMTKGVDTFLCAVLDLDITGTNELKMYKNGVLDDVADVSGTSIDAGLSGLVSILAGQPAGSAGSNLITSPWNGLIADARLWLGKALTASEVLSVYNDE